MSHRFGSKLVRLGLLAGVVLLSWASTATAAADYTWTGGSTSDLWTNGANWAGGLGPTGTVSSLDFPQLTSAACTASPPTATCYNADGLNMDLDTNSLTIDDNQPYDIGAGYDFVLGAGGLTATSDGATTSPLQAPTTFEMGFDLTAPQTWSIDGGSEGDDGLVIDNGEITGSEPLTVDFTNGGFLQTEAIVTSLTASGDGTIIPADGTASGNINAPVTLEDGAGIFAPYGASVGGELSDTGGDLDVGDGEAPEPNLAVNGTLDLEQGSDVGLFIDQTGTQAGDYSTLAAAGDVTLNGAELDLAQGANSNGECVDLNPGDTDTLLSSSGGTITGTFSGVPDGTTVTIDNDCDNAPQAATAVIDYTATTVTATIVSGGDAWDAAQNTVLPSISGIEAVGQTLTGSAGEWSGNPTFTYQWYSCTSGACTKIAGATSTTFLPTAAQLNEQLIFEVTGTNSVGSDTADSDPTSGIGRSEPVNSAAPTISGTTTQGNTLTASPGTWTNGATTYSYQWMRCDNGGATCTTISGATGSTYALGAADVGDTVLVQVAASNGVETGTAASSAQTAKIASASVAPALVKAPGVTGNPVVGQTLVASSAQFSGGPLTFGSVWERCRTTAAASCVAIAGATADRYVVSSGDVGYHLKYLAAAVDGAGRAFGTSATTDLVVSAAQIKTALSKLLGPRGAGATLAKVIARAGYSVRYAAPSTGTFRVTWTARFHGHKVTVARFTKAVTVRGTITVAVKLTAAGRTRLKRLSEARTPLAVTATISATLPGAKAITASRVLALRG